ncbi:hypothetical protein [Agrobacterium tumefaciens]|uniref:hypothetical protein n=1 Tax=Agrobacterium tumefaciens TaxID=358 RepID=UPI002A151082|nr:hypothetical protein [Agrobacterium tumefaciens]MDX8326175.1 hypothetical protein [Agrobacterium tumefaciens]
MSTADFLCVPDFTANRQSRSHITTITAMFFHIVIFAVRRAASMDRQIAETTPATAGHIEVGTDY